VTTKKEVLDRLAEHRIVGEAGFVIPAQMLLVAGTKPRSQTGAA
jgi:hypothetical protein